MTPEDDWQPVETDDWQPITSEPPVPEPESVTTPGSAAPPAATSPVNPEKALANIASPKPGEATTWDSIRANPILGTLVQEAIKSGQGVEQLVAHGAASASDLGGYAPNPVGDAFRGVASHIDKSISAQNKDYEDAKRRVIAASGHPQLMEGIFSAAETAAPMLNPAGRAGELISATPRLANAAVRGALSGAGYAATQPVDAGNDQYWGNKAIQAGEGTAAGAATGTAMGKLAQIAAPKAAVPPTTQELKDLAKAAYAKAEQQGVIIKKDTFKNAVQDIQNTAAKEGADPDLHPKVTAVLKRLGGAAENDDISFEKAETLRRVALSALDSQSPSEKRLAHIVIDKMDDFIGGLKPGDVRGGVTGDPNLIKALNLPTGNAEDAVDALTQARQLYARSAKSATLDRLVEKAKNAVGANYTAAGYDTALRQQFRSLANNPRAFLRFNPDERDAITKVVRGTSLQNALRQVGKLSPHNALSAWGEIALGTASPTAAVATATAGAGARAAAAKMGLKNVKTASELVRRGASAPSAPEPEPYPSVLDPTASVVHSLIDPVPK